MAIELALAGLGALAGSQADRVSQTSSLNLAPASQLELQGTRIQGDQLKQLEQFVGLGPGSADVSAGVRSQRGLASLLEQFSKSGGLPGQEDFATARQFATDAFQPQQVAINQQFEQENQRARQLAAQLGRPANDPIIQAKLSQERMRAQERLGAEQSAYASEFALGLPQRRLGFTAQLADVRGSLASQAMANRQALLGLGSQIAQQERGLRLAAADRTTSQTSGGGLAGAISGGLAGFGAGARIAGLFGSSSSPTGEEEEGIAPAPSSGSAYGPLTSSQFYSQFPQAAPAPKIQQFSAPTASSPSIFQSYTSPRKYYTGGGF